MLRKGIPSGYDLEIKDISANRLFVDSIYANRKEIAFSTTHGSCTDSLKVSLIFRADTVGVFTDTVFIKSNALTPLLKIPVSAKVYSLPGRPASWPLLLPAGRMQQAFTITWTNLQIGMLPIDKIWYSIDTLPKNAAVVKSQPAAGTSASVPITQVGKDTVYFYLEDSLGNKNQDSIGSVVIKFDNNGPCHNSEQCQPGYDFCSGRRNALEHSSGRFVRDRTAKRIRRYGIRRCSTGGSMTRAWRLLTFPGSPMIP